MDYLNKLVEDRNKVWHQMKELNDREQEEKRSLTSEEQESWDNMSNDLDALDKRINELHDLDKKNQEAEQRREEILSSTQVIADMVDPEEEEKRDFNPLRALANGEIRSHTFNKEERDMNLTNSAGLVPQSFFDQVTAVMDTVGVMRNLGTVIQRDSGETLKFPTLTANSSASLISEGGAITESDPTISSVNLGAYKIAFITQISKELLNDSGVDLEGVMANMAGTALGKKQAEFTISGTGSGQPTGLVNVSNAKTLASNSAITLDEILDAHYSMGAEYRNAPNYAFLFSGNTINEIRQLKDGNNQYLWQPAVQVGTPDRLFGVPVYEDPNVGDLGANNKVGYVGDMSRYYISESGGITVERSDEFAFNTDLVSYKFIIRTDSANLDASAIKRITCPA